MAELRVLDALVRGGSTSVLTGKLIYARGVLVAVVSQLDDTYGDGEGNWSVEAWFGPPFVTKPPTFDRLDDVLAWTEQRLSEQDDAVEH